MKKKTKIDVKDIVSGGIDVIKDSTKTAVDAVKDVIDTMKE
jgi:hypothetical protein